MVLFTRIGENISTNLLRGGHLFTLHGSEELNLNVSTDQSKKTSFYIGGYVGQGDVKSYTSQQYWDGYKCEADEMHCPSPFHYIRYYE